MTIFYLKLEFVKLVKYTDLQELLIVIFATIVLRNLIIIVHGLEFVLENLTMFILWDI